MVILKKKLKKNIFIEVNTLKITIRDVAKKANVSVATVSRVINNQGYVYEETRNTVMKIIDELGFEPNQLARSLTNHRSKMIGVIVPHVGTTFYGQLIEGIEQAALSYGYKTMLCNTQDNNEREIDYLKIFEQYNIYHIYYTDITFIPFGFLKLKGKKII